jgi:hypothetical protein
MQHVAAEDAESRCFKDFDTSYIFGIWLSYLSIFLARFSFSEYLLYGACECCTCSISSFRLIPNINMTLRALLPASLVLCALALVAQCKYANDIPTSVQAVIMAPLHRSVARRQSLHVDVDVLMDGGLADVYGILYIDGKVVAHLDSFPVRDVFLKSHLCNVMCA